MVTRLQLNIVPRTDNFHQSSVPNFDCFFLSPSPALIPLNEQQNKLLIELIIYRLHDESIEISVCFPLPPLTEKL